MTNGIFFKPHLYFCNRLVSLIIYDFSCFSRRIMFNMIKFCVNIVAKYFKMLNFDPSF